MQGDLSPQMGRGGKMNRTIKVAAYCRVSTDMADQLHSLSAQIKYFTEYISNHEDYELIEVFYDEGHSYPKTLLIQNLTIIDKNVKGMRSVNNVCVIV